MQMDSRKEKILEAVVLDYIETAEPVGSRTISKKYNLGVSSATIRNEMADLEEMGLIVQPHTSAGRIPSDTGYRYYVDYLMTKEAVKEDAQKYIRDTVQKKTAQVEETVEEILQILTNATAYTSLMLLNDETEAKKLQLLQLLPVEPGKALLVVVTEGDKIENQFITVPPNMSKGDLDLVSQMLNMHLRGLSTKDWQKNVLENVFQELTYQRQVVDSALEILSGILNKDKEEKVFLKGGLNMLAQPEFQDVGKVKNILESLEKKDVVNKIMESDSENEISIKIGMENDVPDLQDCSVIVASYKSHGEVIGKVGLLGPKRMDYSNAMGVLDALLKGLEENTDFGGK